MPENIIQIDQNLLETRLDRLVAEKVAELLNAMLDAEADEIANAAKYERTGERKAYRAGHYDRSLTAKAGRLALKVPKLKCVCSIESGPCERVDVFHVSGRFWSTSACGEKRTPARPAWTSFPS